MKSKAYRASRRNSQGVPYDRTSVQLNFNGGMEIAGDATVTIPIADILSATPSQFTIAFWFRYALTDATPGANDLVWGSNDDGAGLTDGFGAWHSGLGTYEWYVNGITRGVTTDQLDTQGWDQWTHLVHVYDGTEASNNDRASLYVDGVDQGDAAGVIPTSLTRTTDPFHLGPPAGFEGAFPPHCQFKMVAFWEDALSAAEVTTLYNGGALYDAKNLTGPTNLRFVWPCGETRLGDDPTDSTGQITDTSGNDNHGTPNVTVATNLQFVTEHP